MEKCLGLALRKGKAAGQAKPTETGPLAVREWIITPLNLSKPFFTSLNLSKPFFTSLNPSLPL